MRIPTRDPRPPGYLNYGLFDEHKYVIKCLGCNITIETTAGNAKRCKNCQKQYAKMRRKKTDRKYEKKRRKMSA